MKAPVAFHSEEGHSGAYSQIESGASQRHGRQSAAGEQELGRVKPVTDEGNDRTTAQPVTSMSGVDPARGQWQKKNCTDSLDRAEHVECHEVLPRQDLSQESSSHNEGQIVTPSRELPHGTLPKQGMPYFYSGTDRRPVLANDLNSGSPQSQARMALSIEHQLSNRAAIYEETEKGKMERGEPYWPLDGHLLEERKRCKAALWRFNSACNPLSGLSTNEQNRLLREIIAPPDSITDPSPDLTPRHPAGSVGQGVVIEAPFTCNYGYNINIGEDVMISGDCFFVDDCGVNIGAHTWIGPKVTIISSMAHASMQEREGPRSRYQGRPVTIEEACFVGTGSIIYPGVRLRRGAYVAPGEIVKTDIVAYGCQGFKPSYM